MKSILTKESHKFLAQYLNNPAPTGYEWESQKIWMDYLKPYVDDFITDRENKVVTTPAYMYGEAAPHLIFTGIRKALKELVEMA